MTSTASRLSARTSTALILGLLVACVAAAAGCSDDPERPAPSTKDITTFRFLSKDNPGLAADVSATINGTAISALVPSGTDVTALVATFDTSGTSVSIAGSAQISGVTRNNFTAAVSYRVTAGDTTTRTYVVTVVVALSTAKQITSYKFLTANNTGLGADVTATISGTDIAATVPFGTNVTSLVATFSTTGTSVTVGGSVQVSGTTANNFTRALTYRVLAANGSPLEYTVTVTVDNSTAKEITSFKFLAAKNPESLFGDVTATIDGLSISATAPFGSNVASLVATFDHIGDAVTVNDVVQTSDITANDFSDEVKYKVTATDGTSQIYKVAVTIADGTAKEITSYKFLSTLNPGLGEDVIATITGPSISATVPLGTDVTKLIASFDHTGARVAVGTTVQASGQTKNNFTDPVEYDVSSADGTFQRYTVTVTSADVLIERQ